MRYMDPEGMSQAVHELGRFRGLGFKDIGTSEETLNPKP